MLAVAGIGAAVAANPIKEGNMISGHVIVKGTEENIPYATVLIIGSGQGTVSNEEGQFEFQQASGGQIHAPRVGSGLQDPREGK